MALDFPSSPTNGQTYGNYYYDATVGAWNSFSSTVNTVPSTLKNLTVTTDDIGVAPFTVDNSAGTAVATIANDGTLSATNLVLTNDLPVQYGGTGAGTFTTGAYLKGNGTSAIQAQTGIPFADVTMQQIGAAADLNTYVTQGIYHQGSNANAAGGTNYPVAYAGLLEVYQSGTDGSGFTYQRYTVYQGYHAVYSRAKYTTTWGAWQQIPVGTVTVAEGGTGATTLTSGAYLKGAGTSAITAQTGIPAGDITSGSLDIARGGTGATTGSALVPIIPTGGSYGSVSANGLVTFTAGVRLDGIFSATYDSYRIIINVPTTSAAADYLYFRFTTGGAANSTSTYYNGSMYIQSGALGSWSNGSVVNSYSGRVGYFAGDGATYAAFEIHGPFSSSTKTNVLFQSKYFASNNTSITGAVGFNGTTSFDGIVFGGEAGSGAPTGTIQVFGYRK